MTSIARGISLSDYNARSVIVFGLIIALLTAMFFIPEIVGIATPSSSQAVNEDLAARRRARAGAVMPQANTEKEKTVSGKEELRKSEIDDEPKKFESPLKKLLAYFGAGGRRDTEASSPKDAKIGDNGAIDWRALRSKETKKHFTKAERDSRKLAKVVEDQYEQSKYALYNFANGIRNVMKGSNKTMTADEAVQYLAKLDHDVTDSMLAEGVEPSIYNEWADITLGPLFENTAAHQGKIAKKFPFNPQFRILYVKVFQPGDHYGRFVENGKAYVSLKAAAQGRDIKRITIYHNGVKQADRVPRLKKGTATRLFTHLNRDARGVYTFRVWDKRGRYVDRSYVFYTMARHFPWIGKKKGKFDIPFAENDPRLDGLFLFQSSRESKQVSYFSSDGETPAGTQF